MTGLGPFALAAPWTLLALLALPLVWLVVRAVPPPPADVRFPPAALLARIKPTDETPRAAPPWLAILRALALALLVLGLAGPSWNPTREVDARPLVIVVDDGWTGAPAWAATTAEAARLARAARAEVRLVFTAPGEAGRAGAGDALSAADAAARLLAARPKPWAPDLTRAASAVSAIPRGARVVWFSDGLAREGDAAFARALSRIGPVEQRVADVGAVAITRASAVQGGFALGLAAAPGAARPIALEAADARGRPLARLEVDGDGGAGVRLPVDGPVSRDVALLRVAGAPSAGGARLLDAFDRRVRAGLVAPRDDDQPLLSDAHYLEAGLAPFADVTRGDVATLAAAGLDALIVPDVGALPEREAQALTRFVERGGLLVRFAGPRLIAADMTEAAPLLPAPLAADARSLRGGLALEGAGRVGAFERSGPFAGLSAPGDAQVSTLAALRPGEPAPEVWARLADGSPLVTARALGRGTIVLFHTTAGPAWSDVAFSGLQVRMLQRALARASTTTVPAAAAAPTAPLKPTLVLDGFGRARPPGPDDRAIPPAEAATASVGPGRPPGIYEAAGSRLILHAAAPGLTLRPQARLPGVQRLAAPIAAPVALGAPLLLAGVAILLVDALIALMFAGRLGAPRVRTAPASAAALLVAVALAAWTLPVDAQAQRAPPSAGAGDVQLAFVATGEAATDARARAGLEGLSRALAARTSVEPGPVVALDPARDDLARYPLIYWLLPDQPRETSPEAARALDRFMRTGGVLFVDTRGLGRAPGQARLAARAALRGIETPPLERVPDDHVLTKTFYLLRGFPGRFADATLWVETRASAAAGANDGVSPLLLGDGDWASAWATGPNGAPLAAVEGGADRREIAYRVGINVALYALTGNYKADQVHVPALLDRIGPRRTPR